MRAADAGWYARRSCRSLETPQRNLGRSLRGRRPIRRRPAIADAGDGHVRLEQVAVLAAHDQIPEPELAELREGVVDAARTRALVHLLAGPAAREQLVQGERLTGCIEAV